MRRFARTLTILLSVLALVTGPSSKPAFAQQRSNAPQQEEPLTVGEPQGRLEYTGPPKAMALLMIVGDPLRPADGVSMDDRLGAGAAVGWLINSWSVQHGQPDELRPYDVGFICYPASPKQYTLGLVTARGQGDLQKILALAQKRLQEALLEIHRLSMEPLSRKMELAAQRVRRSEERIGQVTAELNQLRQEAAARGCALQPQDPQVSSAVRRDHLALRAELAGLRAQREAIVEQIALAKHKLDGAQGQQRAVLDELGAVLKLKEDELARVQTLFKTGYVTQAEVAKAEVALIQAKADLVDRRRSLVQEAGGGQLGRLNEQLVDAQIAITTTEARLKETDKILRDLEQFAYDPVNSVVIEYQRARRALENAWTEQEAAAADLAKLERTLEAIPAPKVIAIGGGAKPK